MRRITLSLLFVLAYTASLFGQVGSTVRIFTIIPTPVEGQFSKFDVGCGSVIKITKAGDGYVLTAKHVIDACGDYPVYCRFENGETSELQTLATHKDLALLSAKDIPEGTPVVRVADNPLGPGDSFRIRNYDDEIVKGKCSDPTDGEHTFADMTIRPGDSGGPIINENNRIVGVVEGGFLRYGPRVQRRKTWPLRGSNLDSVKTLLDSSEEYKNAEPVTPDATAKQTPAPAVVPFVTGLDFDKKVIQSDVPVLVVFSAVWCGPCRRFAPTVRELNEKANGKYRVFKVDPDISKGLADRFHVDSLPYSIIFRNGNAAHRFSGPISYELLAEKLK